MKITKKHVGLRARIRRYYCPPWASGEKTGTITSVRPGLFLFRTTEEGYQRVLTLTLGWWFVAEVLPS